jgi:type IV secretory pathway VirB6-like protein
MPIPIILYPIDIVYVFRIGVCVFGTNRVYAFESARLGWINLLYDHTVVFMELMNFIKRKFRNQEGDAERRNSSRRRDIVLRRIQISPASVTRTTFRSVAGSTSPAM